MFPGKTFFFFISLFFASGAFSQVMIDSETPVSVKFSLPVTGVSNGPFTGGGFQPSPTIGRLDSDGWAVTGFSDGDLDFGGTAISGDLAKGTVTITGPTVAGIFSYTGSPFTIADPALLIQADDADFTPGTITLRVENIHVSLPIYYLDVSYDLWVRNNEARSSSFNFSYSEDNITYSPVTALNYNSPATADFLGIVNTGLKFCSIILTIDPGEYAYLRWTSDDVSGTGSRDEFYIDEIIITAPTLLPVEMVEFNAIAEGETILLTWSTATELNSNFFEVERYIDGAFESIGQVDAAGTSTLLSQYRFIDDSPSQGLNYYRLKQTDTDGSFSYSKTVSVYFGGDEKAELFIYPNPSEDFIQINNYLNVEDGNIQIFNAQGCEVHNYTIDNDNAKIYVKDLPDGMYSVRVRDILSQKSATFIKL
jgi:hypothetical protein